MSALREKESEILTSLSNSPKSLSELAEELGAGFSKTTVHRIVTSLAKDGRIVASGSGRSAKYEITSVGRLFNPITPEEYFRKEQDDRQALTSFNHELFETLLNHDLFSQEEMERLTERQREFEERWKGLSPILGRKRRDLPLIYHGNPPKLKATPTHFFKPNHFSKKENTPRAIQKQKPSCF